MGISTAPDEYQACMEWILGDLPFVIVYLDDLLVFSENPVDHLEHLCIIFERLYQYDVTVNAENATFFEVDYLVFTLTPEGIQPQTKNVETIMQIAGPHGTKDLCRFLGMIAYYREMVPNKSALTSRRNCLTSKNVPFAWTPEDPAGFKL
ncbi:hypothetical protein ON010_g2190 [Phytophthora cinnamomi]|nr:hypothetical protein ON010_g2190 [Phytophthora cinnamomi]